MLIQLLTEHPEALAEIVSRTPRWVWVLLAGLTVLGLSQWRTRRLPLRRAIAPAVGLALFSLFSLGRDLSATPWLAPGLLVWTAAFAVLMLAGGRSALRPGTPDNYCAGRMTSNTAPPCGRFAAVSFPWWRSTMVLHRASPRPVPPAPVAVRELS